MFVAGTDTSRACTLLCHAHCTTEYESFLMLCSLRVPIAPWELVRIFAAG
jgi:hypothetical protein